MTKKEHVAYDKLCDAVEALSGKKVDSHIMDAIWAYRDAVEADHKDFVLDLVKAGLGR